LPVPHGDQHPIPQEQVFQPVDLLIVNAVEDVSEIGLWIEAVKLCGFDDRHGTRESSRAGVRPLKEPVFLPMPIGEQVISDVTPCMTH